MKKIIFLIFLLGIGCGKKNPDGSSDQMIQRLGTWFPTGKWCSSNRDGSWSCSISNTPSVCGSTSFNSYLGANLINHAIVIHNDQIMVGGYVFTPFIQGDAWILASPNLVFDLDLAPQGMVVSYGAGCQALYGRDSSGIGEVPRF